MKTVYKYPLAFGKTVVRTYEDADINLCDTQGGQICLWMQVDISKPTAVRTFEVFGTGHEIPSAALWVGSCVMPPFVWHVYELPD